MEAALNLETSREMGTSEQLDLVVNESIDRIIEEEFPDHPFSYGITNANARQVLGNYFAMSQAFPYLQAGSHLGFILKSLATNGDISPDVERTFVVSNFLAWDESGGHHLMLTKGNPGLPDILATGKNFHANLLRADLPKILGLAIEPDYSPTTREYLLRLYHGLSAQSGLTRVASMVAFESHAGRMIAALWESISNLYHLDKDRLTYFHVHVGGDDPAEQYHIMMTKRMIAESVHPSQLNEFLREFRAQYALSFDWCDHIKDAS